MSDNFFDLSNEMQQSFLLLAENNLNMPAQVIEKDIWLCMLLEKLFKMPINMAFKGGTSLSKVFKLINRFSEDVDITVDYRNFLNNLDLQNISKSQVKKISKELKLNLKSLVESKISSSLKTSISDEFPRTNFEIEISDDGENLFFYYPSVITSSHGYLRDHVLIEFGVRNDTDPKEKYMVKPFLAELKDLSIQVPQAFVDTLSPIRTFWEKSTLIHVECQRGRLNNSPERLSRHWYDLYKLYNSWVGIESLNNKQILENVVQHKQVFFNASYCNYENCLNQQFKLIPDPEGTSGLKQDFSRMIEAGMFIEEPPNFDELISGLRKLENQLNN